MGLIMETIKFSTSNKYEAVDITEKAHETVKKAGIKDGIMVIFTPHATAAITINENYDPNINDDLFEALNKQVPEGKWCHDKVDGNGAAHIKAAIIGPSESVIIKEGKLILGTWQNIIFLDFDGPKERKVCVEIVKK